MAGNPPCEVLAVAANETLRVDALRREAQPTSRRIEDAPQLLIRHDLSVRRSWFDRLTTNGKVIANSCRLNNPVRG